MSEFIKKILMIAYLGIELVEDILEVVSFH
jgi:hypothetical protein